MTILAPLFFNGSSSVLQVTRNFGQIVSLLTELATLERLKNQCVHFFSIDIDPIFFKLADNEEIYNIFDEFKFRPDWTTGNRLSCPWMS